MALPSFVTAHVAAYPAPRHLKRSRRGVRKAERLLFEGRLMFVVSNLHFSVFSLVEVVSRERSGQSTCGAAHALNLT